MDHNDPINDALKPKLCTKCTDFFALSRTRWAKHLKHSAYRVLEENRAVNYLLESAQLLCPICRTVVQSMSKDQVQLLQKEGNVLFHLEIITGLERFPGKLTVNGRIFQILEQNPTPEWLLNPLLSSHTASNSSWRFLEKSYQDCINLHTKCLPDTLVNAKLPARLIDVGSNSSQEIRLMMVDELANERVPLSYIALTHSWGDGNILKLLTNNLETFKERIPWEALSQTFKDAVNITQRFSIRYLWIDSLCIIQDSQHDWQVQSLTMQYVYSNCILNLAATAAGDGGDGFYSARDPFVDIPVAINIEWEGSQKVFACVRGQVQHNGIMKAALNRRGWVLQERLLSPRTIHFSTQLFWECRELKIWETCPDSTFGNRWVRDEEVDNGQKTFNLESKNWLNKIKETPNTLHKVWWDIVKNFSCCKLTKEEDKLVAISGLVKTIQPFSNDEYLVGLWRNDIIEDLLWYVEARKQADGSDSFRPLAYRAPSWSWASIEGRVLNDLWFGSSIPLIKIMRTQIIPLGDDPTGQVVRACIVVSGNPRPWPKLSSNDISELLSPKRSLFDAPLLLDTPIRVPENSLVLPIVASDGHPWMLQALLLQPTEITGMYRRIGIIRQRRVRVFIPSLGWDFKNHMWKMQGEAFSDIPTVLELI